MYFPPATLIRLYELLKNSRVNQTMLINNKEALFKSLFVVKNGGG